MIIGENRDAVIENIKNSAESGNFNCKVELNDPTLTNEQSDRIIRRYLEKRKTPLFKMKAFTARKMADIVTRYVNKDTETVGLEKVPELTNGAIITSNHFSPLENTVIRSFAKQIGKKRLNIVSQVSNFAMTGILGFLMNYADTIPLSENPHYLRREFISVISELLNKNEVILIYPEQEMWFNYRKPRPIKRGSYYYAAKLNVPVISCFVEMVDLQEKDTDEFYKVKYILHILGVLYPDSQKSVRENSIEMADKDYELKKAAYEKIYNKPLIYTFDGSDIAGWDTDKIRLENVNG